MRGVFLRLQAFVSKRYKASALLYTTVLQVGLLRLGSTLGAFRNFAAPGNYLGYIPKGALYASQGRGVLCYPYPMWDFIDARGAFPA